MEYKTVETVNIKPPKFVHSKNVSHNCGYRMKTKKPMIINSVAPTLYKEDLSRLKEFMTKYLGSYNINSNDIDQEAFINLKKIAEKKRKESYCGRTTKNKEI